MRTPFAVSMAVFLAVAGGLGCKKPARAPAETPSAAEAPSTEDLALRRLTWTIRSAQGASARQTATAENTCTVSCALADGTVRWSRPLCVPATDFRFVSDDCQVVVLCEYPEAPRTMANLVVGTVYAADQEPVALRVTSFLQNLSALRVSGKHVQWLAGVLGVPGEAPRLMPNGSGVAFVTIDKVQHVRTFAAFSTWVDKGPVPDRPVADTALYQWVNAEGSIQIGAFEQIPPKLRSKARKIESDVSVMVNDHRARPSAPDPFLDLGRESEQSARFRKKVEAAEAEAAARNKKPTHDADGRPIIRNALGEDWLEYNQRLRDTSQGTGSFRKPPDNLNDRTTPTCKWAGGKCGSPTDCCSGNCAAGTCN